MRTNAYTLKFFAFCPSNNVRIEYGWRVETADTLSVEELITAAEAIGEGYHEEIADQLFKAYGGEQTLLAEHHGVLIETYRSAE